MKRTLGLLSLIALLFAGSLSATEWVVQSGVESKQVYRGEAFLYQIQVSVAGSELPKRPTLQAGATFSVEDLANGLERRNINGYRTVTVRFNYRITPKQIGSLTLPAQNLTLGEETKKTESHTVTVKAPTEVADYKLRLSLSETTAYVGQPITLTTTWYLKKEYGEQNFTVPVLSDPRFTVVLLTDEDLANNTHVALKLHGERVIARRGTGNLGGEEYVTFSLRHILFPKEAGTIPLPAATLVFDAVVGYRRSRDPFDSPFFGGRGRSAVTKRLVIPSNALRLTVKPLPQAGRPATFNGLVGRYTVAVAAAPRLVNVGDPITLTLTVGGPDYLANVTLPRLDRQEDLVRDFRLPRELPEAKVIDGKAVFTLTVRAQSAKVTAIPPILLPYFDVASGAYREAVSDSIPLDVTSAREVTARDAEGRSEAGASLAAELETWQDGIAHNYEDLSVLEDSRAGVEAWLRSPGWIFALSLPPLLYSLLLLHALLWGRRHRNPAMVRVRKARGVLLEVSRAQELDHGRLIDPLKEYLGSRLGCAGSAVTAGDAERRLRECGVSESTAREARALLESCEASRYAGGGGDPSAQATLRDRVGTLLAAVEREVRG
ncbi:MAG: BatD family protein [Planctomycetota bacterium]|jgi:hypothetical protein